MRPPPDADRSRPLILVALLLSAAAVLVASLVLRVDGAGPSGASPAPGVPAGEVRPAPPDLAAAPADRQRDRAPSEEPESAGPAPLRCLDRSTGAGLAGVRMYHRAACVAGPSDAEGALPVPDDLTGVVTLWAEDRVPVVLRGETLPAEVAFDIADASLELRLVNATGEHRVLRTLIEPVAATTIPKGPWSPVLEERTLDVWQAERVPPGSYDVYMWVVFPDGGPRALSQRAVEVRPGAVTRLSFDLARPWNPEDSEADG